MHIEEYGSPDNTPNAVGYAVPGVGHQWNAERPELFTQMVRQWVESQAVVKGLIPWCHEEHQGNR